MPVNETKKANWGDNSKRARAKAQGKKKKLGKKAGDTNSKGKEGLINKRHKHAHPRASFKNTVS